MACPEPRTSAAGGSGTTGTGNSFNRNTSAASTSSRITIEPTRTATTGTDGIGAGMDGSDRNTGMAHVGQSASVNTSNITQNNSHPSVAGRPTVGRSDNVTVEVPAGSFSRPTGVGVSVPATNIGIAIRNYSRTGSTGTGISQPGMAAGGSGRSAASNTSTLIRNSPRPSKPQTDLTRPRRVAPTNFAAPIDAEKQPFEDRPLPTFAVDRDTAARAAFRKNENPRTSYRLPRGFDPFNDASDGDIFDNIAKSTGTHFVPQQLDSNDNTISVIMWGTKEQCDAAKNQLRKWSTVRAKSLATKWATIHGYIQVREDRFSEKRRKEERRKTFRAMKDTSVLSDQKFSFAIILKFKQPDWMLEENFLGPNMEALDPIRMDKRCHITYLQDITREDIGKIGQGFFLCGNHKELMDEAVDRLMNIDRQVVASQLQPLPFFLLKPVFHPLNYSAHVIRISEYLMPRLFGTPDVVPERQKVMIIKPALSSQAEFLPVRKSQICSISKLDSGAVMMGSRHANRLNIQYIDVWLSTMLEHLVCWQGFMEMRICVGTCSFTQWKTVHKKAQEYGLAEFEDMLQERHADADATGMEAYATTE
jgi:hypothetical protein